jgi:hypothetical protein
MTTIYVGDKTELPERHENDKYVTEKNLIRAALEMQIDLQQVMPFSILDIGAGDGRWGTIAQEMTGAQYLAGVEIEDVTPPTNYDYWYHGDFLTWEPEDWGFDLIVSNPPYFIAEEIIRKAWTMLNPGGSIVMLLRLSFMAGIKRYNGLWKEIWPHMVAVCSRRPSFYGGGTNGTDYGVFYWEKDTTDDDPIGVPQAWVIELINYERGDE